MKKLQKYICLGLLLVTLASMFLPIATFKDDSAAAMQEDIDKQITKISEQEDKLARWIEAGKKQSDLDKQQEKIDKEKAELEELYAEQAALSEAGAGLSYGFLTGKLPEELEIDQTVINQYNIYSTRFEEFYALVYAAPVLIIITMALIMLGGDKLVSKCFTFAGIVNLLAILLIAYNVLRLSAFPIKLPYSDAQINPWVAVPLIGCPIVALGIHIMQVQNTKRTMIYLFCILLSVLAILPFWVMIVNATRSSQQIQQKVSIIPSHYFSYNWQVLKNKDFNILVGIKNSCIIAFGSTILSVYFSALTAYGFKVYDFKGNKFLYAVVLAIIMIPGQVTGTGFYMFMYRIGLVNNYIPLIVPAIASASTVFFFRQYLEANLQLSLVEAARIDGANEFFTFNRITMPIMIPAMATMGIMAVISSWNNYLTPLMLLSKSEMKTLPMMVKELRGDIYRTEYGSIYLGLTMTALPLIIVYFALSKYIIAGVALGGVKE